MDGSQATAPGIGQLILVLLEAVPLSYLASLLLLAIYLRAVKRSMRRPACAAAPQTPSTITATTTANSAPASRLQIVAMGEAAPSDPAAVTLERRALAGPWRIARIYIVAGLGFAVTLATVQIEASGAGFVPMRFVFVALNYAWPLVLTVGLVTAISWRGWVSTAAVYFLALAILAGAGTARSEAFTWDQAVLGWLIVNLPGLLIALSTLTPRIRAVGPMMLVLMMFVVGGWNVETHMSDEQFLWIMELGLSLGLDGMQPLYALRFAGALIPGMVGWAVLRILGGLYRARRISDQSIMIDSIWMFAAVYSAHLASNGPRWFLVGLAAFPVYKIITLLGFGMLREDLDSAAPGPNLLLLRVFSLGRRSAQLFNAFGKLWRHAGSIRLIAGPDLATTTVEPHEFLDFLSGKLARRFISGPVTLTQRLAETDPRRDFDGRYRVSDFFCHDDTWKMALSRLAYESEAVMMDLRGFSAHNSGCIFEINELLNVVALDRVVFVVDGTTDDAFLRETLARGWAGLGAGSPNRKMAEPRVQLFRLTGTGEGSVPALVRSVAGAVMKRGPGLPVRRRLDAGPEVGSA